MNKKWALAAIMSPNIHPLHHAVKELLKPKIPIPANALTKHNRFECVISKLSPSSCKLTIAMMPAVIANMHP